MKRHQEVKRLLETYQRGELLPAELFTDLAALVATTNTQTDRYSGIRAEIQYVREQISHDPYGVNLKPSSSGSMINSFIDCMWTDAQGSSCKDSGSDAKCDNCRDYEHPPWQLGAEEAQADGYKELRQW